MRLIDDWRRVLRHAWSLKFIAGAAVLQGLDVILSLYVGQLTEVSLGLRILAGISAAAAFGARFVRQPRISGGGDGS
jgi:hypothetical protein